MKCHLPAWRAVDGVDVTAICTSRRETAERAARQNGIARAFWDYRAMVSDPDIDVIDIGTRPNLRYEMAKAAISAGKHVYLGVPYAATLAQAEELTALAHAKGVIGASDAYFEHIPAHAEMKGRVDAGEIGDLYSISVDMQVNLFNPPTANFDYFWFAEPENGASALHNLGSHSLTLVTAIFGDVAENIGRRKLFLKEWRTAIGKVIRPRVPDTANVLLQMSSGALATVNISWVASGGIGWRLDAYGSKGRLSAHHFGRFPNTHKTKLFAGRPATGPIAQTSSFVEDIEIRIPRDFTHAPYVAISDEAQPAPCYPMALSFYRLKAATERRGTASPSLDRALHVERIINAVMRSEISGRWEAVT